MSQSKQLVFYWHIISQPGRAVKALLDMAKIQHKAVHLDIFRLQHKKPEYLKINPMGKIPFIVHSNTQLSQSGPIMIYLWQKFDCIPRSYYGETPEQRAQVGQYISWCQNIFRPAMVDYIFLKRDYGIRQKKSTPQNMVKNLRQKFEQAATSFDKLMQGKDYVANGKFTIADLMMFFQVTTFIFYGKSQAEYSNIDRWFKKIYAIPEVKKITHIWFPYAQKFSQVIQGLPVEKASL